MLIIKIGDTSSLNLKVKHKTMKDLEKYMCKKTRLAITRRMIGYMLAPCLQKKSSGDGEWACSTAVRSKELRGRQMETEGKSQTHF